MHNVQTPDFFAYTGNRARWEYLNNGTAPIGDPISGLHLGVTTLHGVAEHVARCNFSGAREDASTLRYWPTASAVFYAYAENVIDTCIEYGAGSECARTALCIYRTLVRNHLASL